MLVPSTQASDLTPNLKWMNHLFPMSQFVPAAMGPRVTCGRKHHYQYLWYVYLWTTRISGRKTESIPSFQLVMSQKKTLLLPVHWFSFFHHRCDWRVQECGWCVPYHHKEQQGSVQEDAQPDGHVWEGGDSHAVGRRGELLHREKNVNNHLRTTIYYKCLKLKCRLDHTLS